MIDFLSKTFIKDHTDYVESKVRGRYGVLCSILSIALNSLMAAFKLVLGMITNSAAITADGFNNLSDVASNVATMLGFVFSVKNPDKEHPFGHGRMEYLASLLIAVLILFVGFQSLLDSIRQIFRPSPVYFSWVAIVVLLISMGIKFWMGHFHQVIGERINSNTLIAVSKDSLSDVLATFATLIALIASEHTRLPIDGILGVVVSAIILKTGYEICKATIASLLGAAPDEALLKELRAFTSDYERVLGTHDLMIHDYGPGRRYLTMHVEVNKNEEMMTIHDVIDKIERDIYREFKVKATIHLDPIDLDDDVTKAMKRVVTIIVTDINLDYSIHDFRIRRSGDNQTLIFDVVIPADDMTPHHDLMKQIDDKVKEHDASFNTLIQIDHSYT